MVFNANAFLQQQAAPLSTVFKVIPEGDHPFIIDTEEDTLKVEEISGTAKKTGKPYLFHVMEVRCICLNEAVRQELGREKVTCRLRLTLDLKDDGVTLDDGPNKNVGLGQLREVLGQNTPGWNPGMLIGKGPFMGRVKHSAAEGGSEQRYADIVKVAPIRT